MNKLIPFIFSSHKALSEKDIRIIFTSMYHSFSDPVILLNAQKKIIEINPAFEQLTGLTMTAIAGKYVTALYEKKIPRAAAFKKKFKQESSFSTNTIVYRTVRGKKLQFQTTINTFIVPGSGKYSMFLLRDIKEQKQKEKHLRLGESQYRFLFEKNPYPMWIFDKKTYSFLAVNDAAVHHYGYTREEFLKMKLADIRPEEERPKLYRRMHEIAERNSTGTSGVWRHWKKNGEVLFAEVSYTDITFNKRRATLIMANDITEKKLSEEATGELNRRIAHILDSITDAFISCDENGKITYINRQAESMLQLKRKHKLGRVLWKEIPADLSKELKKYIDGAIKKQEVIKHDIKWGERIWIRVHIYPSSDGVSMYMNNITDEREISQRRDEFISIASHELKTPVTGIKAFSQLLSMHISKTTDEKALYLLTKMNGQIDRLTELLNDLLDVGRIQSGRLALKKEQFDLNVLIQDTLNTIREIAKDRAITVEGSIDHLISGDKNRVAEVLVNLLTNAIKYSPADKKIAIRIEQKQNYVVVSVQDKGVGIPVEMQKNLFRRFYRINYSGTGEHGGLGLGLYIVRNIIKQHGGDVWVESAAGKGSTFFFSLPLGNTLKE